MSKSLVRRDTMVPVASSRTRGRAEARRDEIREYLAFGLAGERFGLPLASIREILKLTPITEVPRSPRAILGILSVRGRITTVIDLRRRLRMGEAERGRGSRILLVDGGTEVMGLLVDVVYHVIRLHEEEIELGAAVAGDLSEYVFGVGRPGGVSASEAGDDILILLDPGPLLKRS
mgnify:CR=1 FL=1